VLHQGLDVISIAGLKDLWLRLRLTFCTGNHDRIGRVLIGAQAYFTLVLGFNKECVVARFRGEQPAAKPAAVLFRPVCRTLEVRYIFRAVRIIGIPIIARQVGYSRTTHIKPPLADNLARARLNCLKAPDVAFSFCSEHLDLIDAEVIGGIRIKQSRIISCLFQDSFIGIAGTFGHFSLIGAKEDMVLQW